MRKQFGARASSDAVNEIVNDTLFDALSEVKITPASRPDITKIDTEDEKAFTYTVTFEVYPEIKVTDFSKLKVEQAEVKITQSDEDKTLTTASELARAPNCLRIIEIGTLPFLKPSIFTCDAIFFKA
jgi:trigger factor